MDITALLLNPNISISVNSVNPHYFINVSYCNQAFDNQRLLLIKNNKGPKNFYKIICN